MVLSEDVVQITMRRKRGEGGSELLRVVYEGCMCDIMKCESSQQEKKEDVK